MMEMKTCENKFDKFEVESGLPLPLSPPNQADRAMQLHNEAQEELEEIYRENAERGQTSNLDANTRRKLAQEKEQAALMELVKAAKKSGYVRMTTHTAETSRSSSTFRSADLLELEALLALVKAAQRDGHVRLLRRRSTQIVRLPGSGHLSLSSGVKA